MKNDSQFTRIVSLVPSIPETLFALGLGDHIVGKTEHCDWPIECSKLPIVGSFNTVAVDDILSVKPDLVLGTTLHLSLIEYLKSKKIFAEMIPPQPAYEAPESIKLIAHLPLWKGNRRALVEEFIAAGFKAIIVVVNTCMMPGHFLGRLIDTTLVNECETIGVDACGENGEFHTFVYDGPLFARPLQICSGRVITMDEYAFLPISVA